jgi:LPXTG-motif cell wall-anchored protein
MLKRVIAVAVVCVGLFAAPAAAQQYPPAQNQLALSDVCVPPGGPLTLTAGTFTPGAEVTFTLALAPLGTAVADENGVATLATTVPGDASDSAVVAVLGDSPGGPLELSADVTIDADDCAPAEVTPGTSTDGSATPGADDLPRTGSEVLPLVQIGLALAALGGIILAVASKRRRDAAPV